MQTTSERVWAKITALKKPQRRKIVKVTKPKRVRHVPSKVEKYATMLARLTKHYGEALPDLLDFVANRKAKETKRKI